MFDFLKGIFSAFNTEKESDTSESDSGSAAFKTVRIKSHSVQNPLRIQNGDIYDSELWVIDGSGNELFHTDKVNVDSSVKMMPAKVEIENGQYAWIVGMHKNNYKGLFLFKMDQFDKVTDWKQLIDEKTLVKLKYCRDLPSIYPNPKWGNKKVACGINLHCGGWNWDWSEGCITVLQDVYFQNFINHFEINEKGILIKE